MTLFYYIAPVRTYFINYIPLTSLTENPGLGADGMVSSGWVCLLLSVLHTMLPASGLQVLGAAVLGSI